MKQRAFVDHYLQCWNASEAAVKAGYKTDVSGARNMGYAALHHPLVAAAIRERVEALTMSVDELLIMETQIARALYVKYMDAAGNLDFGAMQADGLGHLLKGVKDTVAGRQFELQDPHEARLTIAKHLGLLNERLSVKAEGEVVIRVVYDEPGRKDVDTGDLLDDDDA